MVRQSCWGNSCIYMEASHLTARQHVTISGDMRSATDRWPCTQRRKKSGITEVTIGLWCQTIPIMGQDLAFTQRWLLHKRSPTKSAKEMSTTFTCLVESKYTMKKHITNWREIGLRSPASNTKEISGGMIYFQTNGRILKSMVSRLFADKSTCGMVSH